LARRGQRQRRKSRQEIPAGQVNHLPVVAHFARRLGLVQIVNRLVPTQMAVEPGVIVLALVLDTLSGRSPLYHLQTAFERTFRTPVACNEWNCFEEPIHPGDAG
jgi:hypothetical protein